MIPTGLALVCIGGASLLYLTGTIKGPPLPVSERTGFGLIAASAGVALVGAAVVVAGLR